MTLPSWTTKIAGSANINEAKISDADFNQVKGCLQTGTTDIKPNDIFMEGVEIIMNGAATGVGPGIRYNSGSGQMEFSNGASTWGAMGGSGSGSTLTITAGENLAEGDAFYLSEIDGKAYKTDSSNGNKREFFGFVTESGGITASATGDATFAGIVGGFSGLTPGAIQYLSDTPGTVAETGDYQIGIATSANNIAISKRVIEDPEVANLLIEHELEIIELQATLGVTPTDFSNYFSETYSDSNGFRDLVDTGNTTMLFGTARYEYTYSEDGFFTAPDGWSTFGSPISLNTTSITSNNMSGPNQNAGAGKAFETFTADNFDILFRIAITNHSAQTQLNYNMYGCVNASANDNLNGPYWRVNFQNGGSGDFIYLHDSTGASRGSVQYTTDTSSTYVRLNWNGTRLRMRHWAASQTEPTSWDVDVAETTNIGAGTRIFIKHTHNGSVPGGITSSCQLEDLVFPSATQTGELIIEHDLTSLNIPSGLTHTQLVGNYNAIGTDDITYELEDGSANVDTGLALDTKNAIVNLTGVPEILRIRIDRTVGDAELLWFKSWVMKVWS